MTFHHNSDKKITHNIQLIIIIVFAIFFERIQRRMMIHRWLIGWMIVVWQQIEPIEIFVQLCHIVTFLDIFKASRHGHGKQQSWTTRFIMFTLKFIAQFLHELCIVLTIFGLATITECGIFCRDREMWWEMRKEVLCKAIFLYFCFWISLPQSKSKPSNLFCRKNLTAFLTSWPRRSALATSGLNLAEPSFQPVVWGEMSNVIQLFNHTRLCYVCPITLNAYHQWPALSSDLCCRFSSPWTWHSRLKWTDKKVS